MRSSLFYLILKSLLAVFCGTITTITTLYAVSIIYFAFLLNSFHFLRNEMFIYIIYFLSGLMGGIITSMYSSKYHWLNIFITVTALFFMNFISLPIILPAVALPLIPTAVICFSIVLGGYTGIRLKRKWTVEKSSVSIPSSHADIAEQ